MLQVLRTKWRAEPRARSGCSCGPGGLGLAVKIIIGTRVSRVQSRCGRGNNSSVRTVYTGKVVRAGKGNSGILALAHLRLQHGVPTMEEGQNFADSTQHTDVIQRCCSQAGQRAWSQVGQAPWPLRHQRRPPCNRPVLSKPLASRIRSAWSRRYNNVIPCRGEKRGWSKQYFILSPCLSKYPGHPGFEQNSLAQAREQACQLSIQKDGHLMRFFLLESPQKAKVVS